MRDRQAGVALSNDVMDHQSSVDFARWLENQQITTKEALTAAPADAARLPKSPPGVSNVPKSSSSLAGVLGGVRNFGESTLLDPSGKVFEARVPVDEAGDDVRSGEWDDGALLV